MQVPDSLYPSGNSGENAVGKRLEPLPDHAASRSGGDWDAQAAVRAAAGGELHQDLLEQGVGRLFGISVVATAALGVQLVSLFVLVPRHQSPWAELSSYWVPELVLALALSLALVGITRLPRLRPQHVRDLGYVYLIALCFVLGLMRHSVPWPEVALFSQVAPSVIPILAFAALIPARPRAALTTSLGAALMDPLALALLRGQQGTPRPYEVILLISSPLLAALVGYAISRVLHRLSESIVKAREVGSYRLVERLGVGGMAEVWRADHRMLVRPAAVKLIRTEILTGHGPEASARLVRIFLKEARVTATLNSPHTIQLYDFGVTREGALYYVMELLDGLDLKRLVERFGPLPPERAAYLLHQVCSSLSEAHERELVHRDIKPANIFVCRYGGEVDFVKVLDFGLVLDQHPTAEEIDDEQHFVGTPAVMAPEMVRFQAPVDARADIYSVGCVGYWLLTGQRVFEAQTRHDMLVMHAHQKPLTPSKRVGRPLHAELEAVLMTCLEKNPDRRPQTARELAEMLEALAFEAAWTPERARLWWKREKPTEKIEPLLESAQEAKATA